MSDAAALWWLTFILLWALYSMMMDVGHLMFKGPR